MYALLWHVLPGPWWVRLLIVIVLAALVLAALVIWVFPIVDGFVAPTDVTVDEGVSALGPALDGAGRSA